MCAAHVLPRGTAVLYIGWNAYGRVALGRVRLEQDLAEAVAMLAVIDPLCPW